MDEETSGVGSLRVGSGGWCWVKNWESLRKDWEGVRNIGELSRERTISCVGKRLIRGIFLLEVAIETAKKLPRDVGIAGFDDEQTDRVEIFV